MFKKQFILFFTGILLLVGFFLLPKNREWSQQRVLSYYRDFPTERNHLGEETRKRRRFGNRYIFSKTIAAELTKKGANRDALVLVPPPAYFTNKGIIYPMPEPAVFYYYTGVKITWCHFKDAINATWYARVDQGKIVVDSVMDKKSLQDTITAFLKWKRAND